MNMQDILKQLPEGYKKACWENKPMQRKIGIQNEDILLTLCLYYVYETVLKKGIIFAATSAATRLNYNSSSYVA